MGSQRFCNSPIMSKAAKVLTDFSKIYEMSSMIIWSVCGYEIHLNANLDNRRITKWRSTSKDANVWWVVPFPVRTIGVTFSTGSRSEYYPLWTSCV